MPRWLRRRHPRAPNGRLRYTAPSSHCASRHVLCHPSQPASPSCYSDAKDTPPNGRCCPSRRSSGGRRGSPSRTGGSILYLQPETVSATAQLAWFVRFCPSRLFRGRAGSQRPPRQRVLWLFPQAALQPQQNSCRHLIPGRLDQHLPRQDGNDLTKGS